MDRVQKRNGFNPENEKQGLGFHISDISISSGYKKVWLQPEPSNRIRLFVKAYVQQQLPFFNLKEQTGL
jgi:hypothetical protein